MLVIECGSILENTHPANGLLPALAMAFADAEHFRLEFAGRFEQLRPELPQWSSTAIDAVASKLVLLKACVSPWWLCHAALT